MKEEVTEKNIEEILNKIPRNITPLERVILTSDGTVQTLMSMIFDIPVKVEVVSQMEYFGVIVRWVRLVAHYADNIEIVVCLAESVISVSKNESGFMNGIREKNFGIGQLISSLGFRTTRKLLGISSDENNVARTYCITGDCNVLITEVFPRDALKKAEDVLMKRSDKSIANVSTTTTVKQKEGMQISYDDFAKGAL